MFFLTLIQLHLTVVEVTKRPGEESSFHSFSQGLRKEKKNIGVVLCGVRGR